MPKSKNRLKSNGKRRTKNGKKFIFQAVFLKNGNQKMIKHDTSVMNFQS